MKNTFKIIAGVLLLTIGSILLAQRFGLFLNLDVWWIIGMIWPLILVFFGIRFLTEGKYLGGAILILIGSLLILTNIFSWNFFSLLWPMIIIFIGFSILFNKKGDRSLEEGTDYIKESVIFWGSEKKITSKNFRGGELNVMFGGIKLDLSDAEIDSKGANLVINVAFGGVEVVTPTDCNVVPNGTGILGGWEDNRRGGSNEDGSRLEISGTAMFGGVEIK